MAGHFKFQVEFLQEMFPGNPVFLEPPDLGPPGGHLQIQQSFGEIQQYGGDRFAHGLQERVPGASFQAEGLPDSREIPSRRAPRGIFPIEEMHGTVPVFDQVEGDQVAVDESGGVGVQVVAPLPQFLHSSQESVESIHHFGGDGCPHQRSNRGQDPLLDESPPCPLRKSGERNGADPPQAGAQRPGLVGIQFVRMPALDPFEHRPVPGKIPVLGRTMGSQAWTSASVQDLQDGRFVPEATPVGELAHLEDQSRAADVQSPDGVGGAFPPGNAQDLSCPSQPVGEGARERLDPRRVVLGPHGPQW